MTLSHLSLLIHSVAFFLFFLPHFASQRPPREKNILWNSNIIVDRVSSSVLKTITGSFYVLEGRMNLNANTGEINWPTPAFLWSFFKAYFISDHYLNVPSLFLKRISQLVFEEVLPRLPLQLE